MTLYRNNKTGEEINVEVFDGSKEMAADWGLLKSKTGTQSEGFYLRVLDNTYYAVNIGYGLSEHQVIPKIRLNRDYSQIVSVQPSPETTTTTTNKEG